MGKSEKFRLIRTTVPAEYVARIDSYDQRQLNYLLHHNLYSSMDCRMSHDEVAERFGIAELALQHGADVNYKYKKNSLLKMICDRGKPNLSKRVLEAAIFLLDNGANTTNVTIKPNCVCLKFLFDIYSKRMNGEKSDYYKTVAKNVPSSVCLDIMKRFDYSSCEYIDYALLVGQYRKVCDEIRLNGIPDDPEIIQKLIFRGCYKSDLMLTLLNNGLDINDHMTIDGVNVSLIQYVSCYGDFLCRWCSPGVLAGICGCFSMEAGYEIMAYLLNNKAVIEPSEQNEYCVLTNMCVANYPDLVKMILDMGVDPMPLHLRGYGPLYESCRNKNKENVINLLMAGCKYDKCMSKHEKFIEECRQELPVWTFKNFNDWGLNIRNRMVNTLILQKRDGNELSELPPEIMFMILPKII